MKTLQACPDCGSERGGDVVFSCNDCGGTFCESCAADTGWGTGLPLQKCPHCEEDGYLQPHGAVATIEPTCPSCRGVGELECAEHCLDCDGSEVTQCSRCNGSGQTACPSCDPLPALTKALAGYIRAATQKDRSSPAADDPSSPSSPDLIRRQTIARLLQEDDAVWAEASTIARAAGTCGDCDGVGLDDCAACDASGELPCPTCESDPCGCRGQGVISCEECDGEGYLRG